jgi:hypothetical protein
MSQSLLEDIDRLRGDVARSVFVCKILHAHASKPEKEKDE